MTYEVLARKWRPQVFQDVVGQEHITQTLMNAINTDRLAHAYLFSGARGVGKTSVARILAKAINCENGEPGIPCNQCRSCTEITNGSSVDVQEIDGASNRGIDEIRDLRENIKYMPSSCQFRIYIIDEVHMLTKEAFNALLKTLEEPPPHVKFFFATTEPHKVPVTILSRCQRFDFKRIPLIKIVQQLERITEEEGIHVSRSGLTLLAREAEGSMRDAESLLDQVVSFTGAEVEDKNITDILGIIDRDLIFEASLAVIEGRSEACVEIIDRIYNYGYDIREFYRALMDQFRDLMVVLIAPQSQLIDMTDNDREALLHQAKTAGTERIQQSLNLLIAREEYLRLTSHPRLVLEAIMIKLCRLGDILSFEELMKKIEALEKRLSASPSPVTHELPGHISDPGSGWNTQKRRGETPKTHGDDRANREWDHFLDYLSSKSRSMFNILKGWDFVRQTEDSIEIARGGNAFSANYLDEPQRLESLSGHCRDFFKQEMKIKIVPAGKEGPGEKGPAGKGRAPSNERGRPRLPRPVQDVLQMFQGEIKEEMTKE